MKTRERSRIYGFLSRVYNREPDKDFLESLRNSTFLEVLRELDIELDQDFRSAPLEGLVDELAVEYTRLFIGPGGHVYPYESWYRKDKGGASIDIATEVKNLIESHGLRYRPDFAEGFDHISVELEFMERVREEEAEAQENQDSKKASGFIELGRQFVDEHLIKWVPEFSDRVINEASLSFYRELARLTKEFILLEGVNKNGK